MRRLAPAFIAALLAFAAAGRASADSFTFSASSMKSVMAQGKERTVLVGNAKIVSGDTEISADRIELYGKDFRYADCEGKVLVIDRERGMRITTTKLYYDRVEKFMRMNGPSVIEDKPNKLVIKGNYVENNDKTETTVIQINVRILKDTMACRSEFAVYHRDTKLLELTGMPVVVRGSDEYRADKIVVNVDTEEITMEGNVSGSVTTEKEGEEGADPEGEGETAPEGEGTEGDSLDEGSGAGSDVSVPRSGVRTASKCDVRGPSATGWGLA
jgi:lipopolysaccharide export system protein LptA